MRILKKNDEQESVPASALSDIAFLLLVFFILVSVYSPFVAIPLLLQKQSAKKTVANLKQGEKVIFIGFKKDAIIYKKKKKTLQWVNTFLKELSLTKPRTKVELQVGPKFIYGMVVQFSSSINKYQIKKFTIKSLKKK